MSLAIDSRYITGIYALGQWFKVKADTVDIDAFELTNWLEPSPHDGNQFEIRHCDYALGHLYPDEAQGDGAVANSYGDGSKGTWATPSAVEGISFIDADTGERVSFSLVEVRAFREVRP